MMNELDPTETKVDRMVNKLYPRINHECEDDDCHKDCKRLELFEDQNEKLRFNLGLHMTKSEKWIKKCNEEKRHRLFLQEELVKTQVNEEELKMEIETLRRELTTLKEKEKKSKVSSSNAQSHPQPHPQSHPHHPSSNAHNHPKSTPAPMHHGLDEYRYHHQDRYQHSIYNQNRNINDRNRNNNHNRYRSQAKVSRPKTNPSNQPHPSRHPSRSRSTIATTTQMPFNLFPKPTPEELREMDLQSPILANLDIFERQEKDKKEEEKKEEEKKEKDKKEKKKKNSKKNEEDEEDEEFMEALNMEYEKHNFKEEEKAAQKAAKKRKKAAKKAAKDQAKAAKKKKQYERKRQLQQLESELPESDSPASDSFDIDIHSGPTTRSRKRQKLNINHVHETRKKCKCGKGYLVKKAMNRIKNELECDLCYKTIGRRHNGWYYQCTKVEFHDNDTFDVGQCCYNKYNV